MRESAVCSSGRTASSCARLEPQAVGGEAQGHAENSRPCVLLVAEDGGAEQAIVRSLKRRRVITERARSLTDLQARVARQDLRAPQVVFLDLELPNATGDDWIQLVRRRFACAAVVAFGEALTSLRATRLLGFGVPSLPKPVDPRALGCLALELCTSQARNAAQGSGGPVEIAGESRSGGLDMALESYASVRALSNQQRLILGFYLSGENDKEIARTLLCSEATVYEHWRRMGKKAGGAAKSAVISDFHRFLVRN